MSKKHMLFKEVKSRVCSLWWTHHNLEIYLSNLTEKIDALQLNGITNTWLYDSVREIRGELEDIKKAVDEIDGVISEVLK